MNNRVGFVLLGAALFVAPQAADAQSTHRVSISSAGVEGNSFSLESAISADGRFIAFWSAASNLVADDTNDVPDVFVHDRQTGVTTRISVSSSGQQGNGASRNPAISADGRFVSFYSDATNLVPNDTNNRSDVFVHDRLLGTTELISVSFSGGPADDNSFESAISADGRNVAFTSRATNLTADTLPFANRIFVRDRQTHTTQLASAANGEGLHQSISADGRFVAFRCTTTSLIPGVSGTQVYVRDMQTGLVELISRTAGGVQGNSLSELPSISPDGRYVGFRSSASNLVPGDTNFLADIFLHDRQTGEMTRVNVAQDGTQANGAGERVSVSENAEYIAIESWATNLIPDGSSFSQIFLVERSSGEVTLASVSNRGTQGMGASSSPVITANGRYVTFSSVASNLVDGDTNGQFDVFVRDRGQTAPSPDLNCDGTVDVLDLLIILGAWGPCPKQGSCPGNLNGDSAVDVLDLLILLGAWGPNSTCN